MGRIDDETTDAPLSFQQEQAWFLHRFAPDGVTPHTQATIRVTGTLDPERLDRVVTELHRRHGILRTTFREVDGRPRQATQPAKPVRVRRADLVDSAGEWRDALAEIVAGELREPFDLELLPLIRWTLVRLPHDEYEIIVTQHHLLHDERSFVLLMRDFQDLYQAAAAGPGGSYGEFARWQRDAMETAPLRAQLEHWQKQLSDLPPRLELPADRPRPAAQSFRGATLRVELPPELAAEVRARRVPVRSTLLAAFAAYLYRWTGQRDICLGSSFPGRQAPGAGDLIGMVANTVLLRCEVDAARGFAHLAERLHGVVEDAAANELLPFAELVRALNPAREPGRNPLTDVLFSVDDAALPVLDLAGATGTITERGSGAAKSDLNVVVRAPAEGGPVTMLWEYALDLFDGATVARMADGYLRLLADAIARPDAPLFTLAALSPQERATLLEEWNPERHPAPGGDLPVHEAVRRQARSTPDALAVRDGSRELTYAELMRRAESLAGVLRAHGVLPRTVVGMCLPRGADLVIAELATLCAGAAYLPLDPDNPPVRLASQYAAAGAALIVTDSVITARLPGTTPRLLLDRLPDPDSAATPHAQPDATNTGAAKPDATDTGVAKPDATDTDATDTDAADADVTHAGTVHGRAPGIVAAGGDAATLGDLAYLIATSGSTGQPKIVMVEHGSLSNVVAWRRRRCDLGPADRVAQIASPGFDPSVTDIWPTLTSGATLCVPDQDTKLDPGRLRTWMDAEGITVTELPTALAERVLALDWPAGSALRTLIIGGDRLRVRPAAHLPFRVLNEYGPTEATATATAGHIEPATTGKAEPTDATTGQAEPSNATAGQAATTGQAEPTDATAGQDEPAGPPDIGRPIAGTSVYILDAWRQLMPPGAIGELWIGGTGVARGYHGAPGLTADRFVPDPFSGVPGSRMYRTGDLARHLPDGRIDFIGRRDRQIKLRGYRIEPVEIVEALRAHPEIADAVVLARTGADGAGEKRLVAYLEARDRPGLRQEVREHLAGRVPRYMVPTDLVLLDALPINRNGKVDERALPVPERAESAAGFRAPRTATERWLAETWCAVLGLDRVGLDDNFFEIGGHSLLLFEVQRALAARGHRLSIVTFFEHTTVHDLAAHLAERDTVTPDAGEADGAARRGAGRARLDRRRAAARSARPATPQE